MQCQHFPALGAAGGALAWHYRTVSKEERRALIIALVTVATMFVGGWLLLTSGLLGLIFDPS